MSNPSGDNPYLINRYGSSTASRLTRKNLRSANTAQKQTPQTKKEEKISNQQFSSLLPKTVSELSPNVIFQDMDESNQGPKPQSHIKRSQKPGTRKLQQNNNPPINQKTSMGVLTNAFMDSTTRYQKTGVSLKIATPVKDQQSQPKTPRNSQSSSQHGGMRFARKRGQSNVEQSEISAHSSPKKADDLDSNTGTNRKIERRPAGRQALKFHEKKQQAPQRLDFGMNNRRGSQIKSYTSRENVTLATSQAIESSVIGPDRNQKDLKSIHGQSGQVQNSSQIFVNDHENVSAHTKSQVKRSYQPVKPQRPQSKGSQQQMPQKSKYFGHVQKGSNPNQVVNNVVQQMPPLTVEQTKTRHHFGVKKIQQNLIANQLNQTSSGVEIDNKGSPTSNSLSLKAANVSKKAPEVILADSKAQQTSLRKSVIIRTVLRRILISKVNISFMALKQKSKSLTTKLRNEANLLVSSCSDIIKQKQLNFKKQGFGQLKKKFLVRYIDEIKPILVAKVGNPGQNAVILIRNIYLSKMRKAFTCLNNKSIIRNQMKGMASLEDLLRYKKIEHYRFSFLKIKMTFQDKNRGIFQLLKISIEFWNQQKQDAFNLISQYSCRHSSSQLSKRQLQIPTRQFSHPHKIPQSPQVKDSLLGQKTDKLKSICSSLHENISKIQRQVNAAKQQSLNTNEVCKQKVAVLKDQNNEIKIQLAAKKDKNEQILQNIRNIATLKPKPEQMEEVFQPISQKLEKLSNIYISNFQLQNIQKEELTQNCAEASANSLIQEWSQLNQNSELKKLINSYEKVQPVESRARRIVLKEQQMILKLVRSYIKEQYFWQWLHISTQGL